MLIVADENIPCVTEAFGSLGDVTLMPGRSMTPETLGDAELLLVRSVTRVNADLLAGTRVRFVGTATIGTDHVDTDWLRHAGIRFAAAPGSNSNSVAEYIVAALLVAARRRGRTLAGRSIGVIGVGNVGSRVAAKARALRMQVLLNDPPLQRATGDPKYVPLHELFGCDFLTLHVPFERSGPDPTYHMVDDRFLSRMRPDAVLLNTSRGGVVESGALVGAAERGHPAAAVLDVWEGEPRISIDLLERAMLGTPHIAGYSLDGKVNGTEMIYRAACESLGVEPTWTARDGLAAPDFPQIFVRAEARAEEEVIREAVLTAYPIERDDEALREIANQPPAARGAFFDRLRREYPVRREFQNVSVQLAGAGGPGRRGIVATLRGIGFGVGGE